MERGWGSGSHATQIAKARGLASGDRGSGGSIEGLLSALRRGGRQLEKEEMTSRPPWQQEREGWREVGWPAGPRPRKRRREGVRDWALQAERRRERGEKEFHFSFSKTIFQTHFFSNEI